MLFQKKGTTLIEIMMVVAIIALVAAIAIPNILRARVISNEAVAQETLKAISTALENYQIITGTYPAAIGDLLSSSPSYINKDYFSSTCAGYDYTVVTLADYIYSITATPSSASMGTKIYNISTGAILVEL